MRIPIPTPHTLPFTFLHITLSLELFSGTLACSGDGPHNHYDRSHVEGFARSMERPTLPNPDDKLSQLEWGEVSFLFQRRLYGYRCFGGQTLMTGIVARPWCL